MQPGHIFTIEPMINEGTHDNKVPIFLLRVVKDVLILPLLNLLVSFFYILITEPCLMKAPTTIGCFFGCYLVLKHILISPFYRSHLFLLLHFCNTNICSRYFMVFLFFWSVYLCLRVHTYARILQEQRFEESKTDKGLIPMYLYSFGCIYLRLLYIYTHIYWCACMLTCVHVYRCVKWCG